MCRFHETPEQVYVYEPEDFEATLKLCDETSDYALTGSIFATERSAGSRLKLHPCSKYCGRLQFERFQHVYVVYIAAVAVFAVRVAEAALRNAAGNFYVNDKCTGAAVGEQPFGSCYSLLHIC